MTPGEIREVVVAAVREIAGRATGQPRDVDDAHRLTTDLGLVSLDVAELVAVLEMTLGTDPFAAGASITDVRTVGDLVRVYQSVRS